ncbi:hypothetical protein [Nocardia sp. alder85J]|nr:hypothetical protein [Nocardia sp. alder85J]MCX4095775.1 hypothetical protein [Nocardia sp. alder85J]
MQFLVEVGEQVAAVQGSGVADQLHRGRKHHAGVLVGPAGQERG